MTINSNEDAEVEASEPPHVIYQRERQAAITRINAEEKLKCEEQLEITVTRRQEALVALMAQSDTLDAKTRELRMKRRKIIEHAVVHENTASSTAVACKQKSRVLTEMVDTIEADFDEMVAHQKKYVNNFAQKLNAVERIAASLDSLNYATSVINRRFENNLNTARTLMENLHAGKVYRDEAQALEFRQMTLRQHLEGPYLETAIEHQESDVAHITQTVSSLVDLAFLIDIVKLKMSATGDDAVRLGEFCHHAKFVGQLLINEVPPISFEEYLTTVLKSSDDRSVLSETDERSELESCLSSGTSTSVENTDSQWTSLKEYARSSASELSVHQMEPTESEVVAMFPSTTVIAAPSTITARSRSPSELIANDSGVPEDCSATSEFHTELHTAESDCPTAKEIEDFTVISTIGDDEATRTAQLPDFTPAHLTQSETCLTAREDTDDLITAISAMTTDEVVSALQSVIEDGQLSDEVMPELDATTARSVEDLLTAISQRSPVSLFSGHSQSAAEAPAPKTVDN